jgi:hypothetical protein
MHFFYRENNLHGLHGKVYKMKRFEILVDITPGLPGYRCRPYFYHYSRGLVWELPNYCNDFYEECFIGWQKTTK